MPALSVSSDQKASWKPETEPLRRCIITRDRLRKEDMIRFVLGPKGVLAPDFAARLPGRGIWLSARADMVESARAKGTLARGIAQAIRAPVSVPADLVHSLEAGLIKRICQLLGFARRAGQAVAGFEKVREWLRAGDVGLVVQASDGSPEECSRLMAEVRAEGGRGPEHLLPVLAPLGAAEMGRIFGRREVFEVAIAPGRLTNKLVNETERLSGIAGSTMVQWVGAAGANRKIERTSND